MHNPERMSKHLCPGPGTLYIFVQLINVNSITTRQLVNVANVAIMLVCGLAKADCRPREKKKFYHQFSIVKYSYLPTDTFRKYVEMHVTRSKLTLKFTGYCRQTSYTDSTVIHTLVPAVAWELQSQFAPGYMHVNIFFKVSLRRYEYFTMENC